MKRFFFEQSKIIPPRIITLNLLLTAMVLIFSFSSCTKEKLPRCEKWEVKYESFNIGGCVDFSCGGRRTVQLIFCDKTLENAGAGNTVIISQDQCCKKTMTFIRFIE